MSAKRTSNSYLVFAILLLVVFLAAYLYKVQNHISLRQIFLAQQEKKQLLKQSGINADSVNIAKIATNFSWQSNNFSYTLKNVYWAPDIADIGNQTREKYEIGDTNAFLIAEVEVKNIQITTAKRKVEATRVIRARTQNKNLTSVMPDTTTLGGGETSTEYVIFAAPKAVTAHTVIAGSKSFSLNFASDQAVNMTGVFLSHYGYASEYPLD